MACTTILVGRLASNDGSTLISRNDDSPSGVFEAKKVSAHLARKGATPYRSKIAHLEVKLPEESLAYIDVPSVDNARGVWGASGINEAHVSMTATETITSNPRVLGADPLVEYVAGKEGHPGGIGEEDLVSLVLPYIHSAREGVLRLGALLEAYGTYESNGIAFSDEHEIWWLETIGDHHWIARRVGDEEVVIMPNAFGLDRFSFEDAYNEGKENLCSKDLLSFVRENNLDLSMGEGEFNPRLAFGSHSDSDHVYNTPRAWYLLRYFNPSLLEELHLTPESDDIPWAFRPAKRVTIEDVKYAQGSHYQGTEYDCYQLEGKGKYRPIGISRTSFLSINALKEGKAPVFWLAYGSNVYNTLIPLYAPVSKIPTYLGGTTLKVRAENFYWASRLVAALTDPHYKTGIIHVERYQEKTLSLAHAHLKKWDAILAKEDNPLLYEKANQEISDLIEKETDDLLSKELYNASCLMKNGFSRSDN